MSRLRSGAVVAVLALTACAAMASTALAQAGPISLVSSNGIEQADFAETPAISADGRFVAFKGRIGGQTGIFRKDLSTGELVLVAGEKSREPSISADGRYVSFTTTQALDPGDDSGTTSDVYVADLANVPIAYELASAIDGCNPLDLEPHTPCGLTYEGTEGSAATGRVSLSADGREVVFVTTVASNLTEPSVTSEPLPTPPLQVAVRNLETDRTTLISTALGSASGDTPVEGGAVLANGRIGAEASINADGSTVAWLGRHLAAQVPLSPAEGSSIAKVEAQNEGLYGEPLVRRIPTGPTNAPPTLRIVTGQDFPEMISGANLIPVGNCSASSGWNLGGGQAVPVLSADGDRVALIGQPDGYTDAFMVDLAGATPTVHRLTASPPLPLNNACEAAGKSQFYAGNAEIKTIAISPDGERIAFTTKRQRFPLSPPNLVTSPPVGVGVEELYLVDLRGSTLERLTHGTTLSEPSLLESFSQSGGANSVSFDGDGETLAFASPAYNLVPGDGNGGGNGAAFGTGSDAFLVGDPRSEGASGSTRISAPPPAIRPRSRWALTAHASSLPDGSVRVAVGVPGAGKLGAVARTAPTSGKHVRKVAAARRQARLASVLVFILHPARSFRSELHAKGLEAALRLHFVGKGGKPLTEMLNVRFRSHRAGKKGHAK